MSRNKKNQSRLPYQNLENRCLLAADFGLDLGIAIESAMVVHDCPNESNVSQEMMPFDMLPFDMIPPEMLPPGMMSGMGMGGPFNGTFAAEPTDEIAIELPANHLDLMDGSDGVFGTFTEENSSEHYTFTAPGDGAVNVVASTSFGDSQTEIQVRDEMGNIVVASSVEDLDGFQQLIFNVEAGHTYELSIAASDKGTGSYQVTVQFEEAEPKDIHADKIGSDATPLDMSFGDTGIAGDLEHSGDVDVFQFVAAQDGEVNLFAGEMTDGNGVQLNVTVSDSEGNEIVSGSTNEFVETKFDVVEGETYYVSISANEEQTGSYSMAMHQEIAFTPTDQHVNEIGSDATLLDSFGGLVFADGELETPDDADAFRFTAESDGEMHLSAVVFGINEEGQSSELKVSIYDQDGELVTEGMANEHLSLKFDTTAGSEYQVLVESANDIPATYHFDATQIATDGGTGVIDDGTQDTDAFDGREVIDLVFEEFMSDGSSSFNDFDMFTESPFGGFFA